MRTSAFVFLSAFALLSTAGCAQTNDLFGGSSSQASQPLTQQNTMSVASLTPQEMMGKNVITNNGQKIGEVEDVLLRKNSSRASHVVIGAGGFLGIGEHNVALDVDKLRWSGDHNALVAMNTTRDQIANLPEYHYDGSVVSLNRPKGSY
ncbi:PRC-barrel domain-containing protein [Azospirillum sp. TSO22-1]|uniref:PRC-barrel domain-containing protein n=1 Tax=Azospirillum sp. TSO22-1 TaxID=716789 RepID=UPI000D649AEA|nr:PRC-barrel domain-containing protein [Azospirillum sp. TSO22-1]